MAKAIELYKNHLSKSPNNIKAMSRLTFCLMQNGQTQEAQKVAGDIIQIYPNSPVGYIDLSYVYLNNNKIELAIETANKALDASPIDAEAVRVKAIAYSEQKNFSMAEECFKEALQLSPDNPEILRDLYHFFRNAGRYKEMEETVQKVIKQEYPYCMEDFWFFADYYRENGQNLKAFHYLNKAYRCMPGEKDIIPPMAEILFEMGHTSFAVPLLKKYVETKGWDEMMRELTYHKKIQGNRSQEGMRLLQFHGQKLVEYRKFIFNFYIKRFLFLSFYTLSVILTILSYLFFRLEGLLIFSLVYISTLFSYKITTYLIEKKRVPK
jgi:tetratricopeptide (TPR) repeat protein